MSHKSKDSKNAKTMILINLKFNLSLKIGIIEIRRGTNCEKTSGHLIFRAFVQGSLKIIGNKLFIHVKNMKYTSHF